MSNATLTLAPHVSRQHSRKVTTSARASPGADVAAGVTSRPPPSPGASGSLQTSGEAETAGGRPSALRRDLLDSSSQAQAKWSPLRQPCGALSPVPGLSQPLLAPYLKPESPMDTAGSIRLCCTAVLCSVGYLATSCFLSTRYQ